MRVRSSTRWTRRSVQESKVLTAKKSCTSRLHHQIVAITLEHDQSTKTLRNSTRLQDQSSNAHVIDLEILGKASRSVFQGYTQDKETLR
jgi:hypothetical protein